MGWLKDLAKRGAEKVLEALNEDEVDESKVPFLHGVLQVHVIEAEDLPDTDTVFFNIDGKDVTDPYVIGQLGQARLFKTKYILNSLNPKWDEKFTCFVCHHATSLKIQVRDKEHIGDALISSLSIRTCDLLSGETIEGWFDLMNGGQDGGGRLNLSLTYTPKEDCCQYQTKDLCDSYFKARTGNRVILYQDADTPQLPIFEGLTDPNGDPYVPPRAWIDLYNAISNAKKFIYITGWSVATSIRLIRDPEFDPDGEGLTVGELLKRKADEEGVRVLLMIWNEKLSTEDSPGLMGTHDEETRLYFEDSAVECLLTSRVKFEAALASEFVSSCYTHHQKTVICDDDRRIIAFIGGLDITDGRYDSPEFPLYSTINGEKHRDDFYNNVVVGVTQGVGPREPWHDCHAKVEGPIALDIKKNFEERWCRQGGQSLISRLYHVDEDEFDEVEEEAGDWTVQLFRSITSDSCIFDFEKTDCLHSKGGRLIENSILRDMVVQIRNAKKFLYLENQYFLGSAYSWLGDKETLTQHVVPREITQKIVEKISEGEDFVAYILVPMFPEGDPSSAAIQEILFWQFRTMETMYRRIAKAISEFGVEKHPTDYLSFYCLGKRESPDEVPEDLEDPEPGSHAEKVRNTLRLCIYVHSKMTIIDDDYIIVGSANINQRSLGGNRDSEIAIGAFQPDQTMESCDGEPRGGVHTYRMALWSAHLGGYDEAYLNPASPECLEKVREVTQANWELFTADEPAHSDVHMLPYPIQIDEEGRISALDEPWNCFPDTSAPVLGAKSGYLPGKLTT